MYVSSFKFELIAKKKSQNLLSSIDWKLGSTNRESQKIDYAEFFKQCPSPRKRLGFQSNLSTYKRETLTMFWKFIFTFGRLVCYFLWDLSGVVPSNYTSIYQSKIYKQALVEPSCCYKDQQLKVIWNLWVGSQSHNRGYLCSYKSKKRRSSWIRSLHVVVSVSYYLR